MEYVKLSGLTLLPESHASRYGHADLRYADHFGSTSAARTQARKISRILNHYVETLVAEWLPLKRNVLAQLAHRPLLHDWNKVAIEWPPLQDHATAGVMSARG